MLTIKERSGTGIKLAKTGKDSTQDNPRGGSKYHGKTLKEHSILDERANNGIVGYITQRMMRQSNSRLALLHSNHSA
jgi:hypothetical protein